MAPACQRLGQHRSHKVPAVNLLRFLIPGVARGPRIRSFSATSGGVFFLGGCCLASHRAVGNTARPSTNTGRTGRRRWGPPSARAVAVSIVAYLSARCPQSVFEIVPGPRARLRSGILGDPALEDLTEDEGVGLGSTPFARRSSVICGIPRGRTQLATVGPGPVRAPISSFSKLPSVELSGSFRRLPGWRPKRRKH